MYVLDTDHITALERGGSAGQQLASRLVGIEPMTTTIISYEEQTRGWLNLMAQARTAEKQVEVYRRLKKHLTVYCSMSVLDFDDKSATTLQRLQMMRVRIGTMDLKIAIALSNDATLLTRNLSDFNQVSDLRAENWLD